MENELFIFNSLTREKERFEPLHKGLVGMYVCGPTVYSDVHLGNCRTFVSFDVIYRYLMTIGYTVRYVRNITDVGHLEGDQDIGEDKISKRARLEKIEPMEVVQRFSNGFHQMMQTFNVLPPSIEPRATGHIIDQIEMIQQILANGYAYCKNGSVYFDTPKFMHDYDSYGQLSGRVVEELISESRQDLKGQEEKNHPADFALWIKADANHLMRWPSPWSIGFPGWHLECSVMSTKYLGKQFDIHGGGSDLKFPHHENEIAQNIGAHHQTPAKYWLHGNMLLLNGKKMSKSEGNTITPFELFSGNSSHINKGYHPMIIRFFMLQAHYRSTIDLTQQALDASEKGYLRLMEGNRILQNLIVEGKQVSDLDREISQMVEKIYDEMNDDFNTPKALARLFELVNKINALHDGHIPLSAITQKTLELLKSTFHTFIYSVFGLKEIIENESANGLVDGLMELILDIRRSARVNKDWKTADQIRDTLTGLSIQLKDGKDGTSWTKG